MAADTKQRRVSARAAKSETKADNRQPLPLHPGARLTARVALAVMLLAAALWTAADFLPALVWAAILAIAVWPLYVRLVRTDFWRAMRQWPPGSCSP